MHDDLIELLGLMCSFPTKEFRLLNNRGKEEDIIVFLKYYHQFKKLNLSNFK